MVRQSQMTTYSWKQQYNETEKEYQFFKIYLELGNDRTIQNVQKTLDTNETNEGNSEVHGTFGCPKASVTPPDIETLTHIADEWKWIPRSIDYDIYHTLLKNNRVVQYQIQKIDEKSKWLDNKAIEIRDASIKIEKKLLLIEKIVEIKSKIAAERQKSVKIIEKSLKKWQNYDKNRYNFEAEKMKELEKIIHDYDNGYLSSTEFNVETKDYADELIENIRKQKYDNKTNRTH